MLKEVTAIESTVKSRMCLIICDVDMNYYNTFLIETNYTHYELGKDVYKFTKCIN